MPFQIYAAKSLQSGDEADAQSLQATEVNKTTAETTITTSRTNLIPTLSPPPRIASFFKKLNLLPLRNLEKSSEDDENNEIDHGDVIEIEVPMIGSDFVGKYQSIRVEANEAAAARKGYTESTSFITTQSSPDISQTETVTDDVLTLSPDFQTAPDDATTLRNAFDTTTQPVGDETTSPVVHHSLDIEPNHREHFAADIRSAESKLMGQWKAADDMIDGSFESKIFTLNTQRRGGGSKYPFNVRIVVNNEDEKKSCKTKSSCSQVSFSRSRDYAVDPQFYSDYSDEDLFFKSEPERYLERPNGLRARNARRAADDMLITPAPRFPPVRALKKPSFIEQLENESSLERSERINKNLDGFMRFISVWAQVDKFVSDRARGAVRKLAYLSDDDYGDDFMLGSRRRVNDKKRTVDEPFT